MNGSEPKIDRETGHERRKWDAYYDSLPLHAEDEATRRFNSEFAERISALLEPQSEVLEAGCGGGWQSVALARTGRFDVSVLDFSPKALEYSRRIFERERLSAQFLEADIRDHGDPAFDLVFNAGVLEHYTLQEQAALLRGMASRSRRYVLILVPNALCYWYWLWRIHKAASGDWPFGKEVPLSDLSEAFQEAGLHFCGQAFLGQAWSEAFIEGLPGMDPALKQHILEIHRSPLIPLAQRSYLVAALGSVSADDRMPHGWTTPPSPEHMGTAEMRALIADTLAIRIGSESQVRAERKDLESKLEAERQKWESVQRELKSKFAAERGKWESDLEAERQKWESVQRELKSKFAAERGKWESDLEAERREWESKLQKDRDLLRRTQTRLQEFQAEFEKQLSEYRSQRAWRIMLAIRKAYTVLVRRDLPGVLSSDLDKFELTFPDVLEHLPADLHAPLRNGNEPALPAVDRYDVIVLPIFDFEFRFQRPQQVAAQFARAGHRVFWISPSRLLPTSSRELYESVLIRENIWEIRLRAAPFDLYRGALEPSQIAAMLDGLGRLYEDFGVPSSCAFLQFPFWRRIGLGLREEFGAKLVYDCMDDWQNWPADPLPGAFSLAEERELVHESDVLVVTSRELQNRHSADRVESKLIPNAADFDFFRNAPASSLASDIKRPVVGYYGAIADWFDLDLMIQVARSRPQYSFVLIGQVHQLDVSELKALPNTYLLGEKPYSELPGYLRGFDVCTLPFRMNRLTKSVDPVKVYEYICQGKPVVSVPLAELAPMSELLYFAEGPEEFSSQIDSALAERDAVLEQKRIAFASKNTWKDRFDILDRAIGATYPLVSILVVTYNTREYLAPFFHSIRRHTSYPAYEVIVVDNDSNDGSVEELHHFALRDPRIRVECLKENLGFAGGNNFAARMAQGEYLVLLNPDTIVTAGWLERLMGALNRDASVGVVAPVSNFSGNETKINTHYRSLRQMESFAAKRARDRRGEFMDIDTIPLFCGLIRRKLWEEVGALDEGFQIGMFEDDDFSVRIRKAGYRIVTAEDCFIHHFGNGSFGKLKSEDSRRIFEQNKKRFESKWNAVWLGHKTRPGVSPISEETKIPLSEFFADEGSGGA
jgi:GT2 family glycosyltransferase/SAM-dependent methyltransferase